MRVRGKALLASLSFSPFSPIKRSPLPKSSHRALLGFTPISTTAILEKERDSLLLEKFRLRKLKGSSATQPPLAVAEKKSAEKGLRSEGENADHVVTNFKELGLREELIEALEDMGMFVPSEIQCIGIPPVLEGKNVVLSSQSGSCRILSYLLPLIQLLLRDVTLFGSKSKHPRAVLLCATKEQATECFNVAEYIIHNAQMKSAMDSGLPNKQFSNAPIGLVIGTPSEILQYIEEGTAVLDEIKYLILDEADSIFDRGLGLQVQKIIEPLRDNISRQTVPLQTVVVTSTISEMLGKGSPIVKRLEGNHGGEISAMLLEIEHNEVFNFTESPDALKKKVAEAMNFLL